MSKDAVRSNYNSIGIAVIEMMYSTDYLSIGGAESTQKLADLAGLRANDQLLDVGCGLGGPALHLAAHYGVHVTGLDLVDVNIAEANKRAAAASLSAKATFQQGDAIALPFDAESYDVVWGQDAWCHVPDKRALIEQCARVLRPGGCIAFSDWLELRDMSGPRRDTIYAASASTNMQTYGGYAMLLDECGFDISHSEDISADFVRQYAKIMQHLPTVEAQVTHRFGPKTYAIVLQKNTDIADAFEDGLLGGGLYVATKRAVS